MIYEPYKRRASASQINILHGCKMQWYQSYILKNKSPQTAAMAKGTLLHSISEGFYALDINKAGIHSNDYEQKFKTWMWEVFEKELHIPRDYFGKVLPSISESLHEMYPDPIDYAFQIGDVKTMVNELFATFLREYKVKFAKYNNIQRAWYICKPKHTEYKLQTDDCLGFLDELIDDGKNVIITDLKTSNSYKTLFSQDHERQLQIYASMLYDQTGKLADYGVIKWIRTGFESCYKLGMDGVEAGKSEIEWYKIITESENIEDYPCNLDYPFCTCNAATKIKNRGKGWCHWAPICNKMLGCEDEGQDEKD